MDLYCGYWIRTFLVDGKGCLLSSIHYDSNDRRRLLKQKLLNRHGIIKFDIIREGLIWLLLPPWYWVVLSRIKQRRT